jgi:hypothetical protein
LIHALGVDRVASAAQGASRPPTPGTSAPSSCPSACRRAASW